MNSSSQHVHVHVEMRAGMVCWLLTSARVGHAYFTYMCTYVCGVTAESSDAGRSLSEEGRGGGDRSAGGGCSEAPATPLLQPFPQLRKYVLKYFTYAPGEGGGHGKKLKRMEGKGKKPFPCLQGISVEWECRSYFFEGTDWGGGQKKEREMKRWVVQRTVGFEDMLASLLHSPKRQDLECLCETRKKKKNHPFDRRTRISSRAA